MSAYKTFPVLLVLFLMSLATAAQKYQHIPDDLKRFHSMDEAMVDPLLVECLDLSRSGLREFPAGILEMKNLRYLVLSRNRIETLPDSISILQKLEYLDIARNQLVRLPASIGSMKKLHTLILRQNLIGFLPEEIGSASGLQYLDIWGTYIASLPPTIGDLSASLLVLNMRHVPMSRKEQERIFSALPATRIYYTAGCKCDD